MGPDLDVEVATIGDTPVRWRDVREAPSLLEWWDEQLEQAGGRSAAYQAALQDGTAPTDDDVHAAGVAFRQERRLLAADDLREWLETWGLEVDDWRAALARLATPLPDEQPSTDASEDVLWAHVAVSGTIGAALRHFAAEKAASVEQGDPDGEVALDQALAAMVTEHAVLSELDRRRLDWTSVDLSLLSFSHEDAAREAVLVIDHDGEGPAVVSERAEIEPFRVETTVEMLPPTQQGDVLSARLGQAVGPFHLDDDWDVVVLHDRRVPDDNDAGARARAIEELTARALDRLIETHVAWRTAWQ